MTKAEAIAMLKRIQEPEAWEQQITQSAFEALDMAIEALSQESSEDVISRQAAIDALDGEIEITGRTNAEAVKGYVRLVKDRLERLPSAQPEIIRCKDCKHYNGEDRDICCPLADYAQSKCGADWFCADGERKEEDG